jgi:CDP-2,3-bis-(O-geranylgeranyl)-sn-glycerol synthase
MTDFWNSLFCILWIFIPAGVANMAPVFAAHISWLKRFNAPLDGGKHFHGQRIFGANKTWRGLLAGMFLATLVLLLQQYITRHNDWFLQLTYQATIAGDDYTQLPALFLGPLFAIGALGGDAFKSFLKRRVGVAPGKKWFPFDQIDFIIGGALLVAPFIRFSFAQYVMLLISWVILDMIVTYIGWLLKLKEAPL